MIEKELWLIKWHWATGTSEDLPKESDSCLNTWTFHTNKNYSLTKIDLNGLMSLNLNSLRKTQPLIFLTCKMETRWSQKVAPFWYISATRLRDWTYLDKQLMTKFKSPQFSESSKIFTKVTLDSSTDKNLTKSSRMKPGIHSRVI